MGAFKVLRGRVAHAPPPDITVSNTAQLNAAFGTVTAGQTIGLNPGSYAGVDLGTHTFSPPITITSTNTSDRAILNFFEGSGCAGYTFKDLDFVVLLPAFYGWRFDNCDSFIFDNIKCRSNGTLPADYEEVTGIRVFTGCSNFTFKNGSEFYRLNETLQFGLGAHDFLVQSCHFHDMNSDCIDLGSCYNGVIELNYMHDWVPTGGNHPDAIQMQAPAGEGIDQVVIRKNLLYVGAGEHTQGFFLADGTPTHVTIDENCVVGTGVSAIRPIGGSDITITNNQLITFIGDEDATQYTNINCQTCDRITVTGNVTLAGALSTASCTNVTSSGNTTNAAVSDNGAAAIAAFRALHPTIPS